MEPLRSRMMNFIFVIGAFPTQHVNYFTCKLFNPKIHFGKFLTFGNT